MHTFSYIDLSKRWDQGSKLLSQWNPLTGLQYSTGSISCIVLEESDNVSEILIFSVAPF